MSKSVGSYAAKTHLPRLLQQVERGARVTITNHGRPVAVLIPAGSTSRQSITEVIAALRTFRKGLSLGRLSLRKLIDEGRR